MNIYEDGLRNIYDSGHEIHDFANIIVFLIILQIVSLYAHLQ